MVNQIHSQRKHSCVRYMSQMKRYHNLTHVPPHRVGFLRRCGLKTGIHFAQQFGLESGMVFEGTTGFYERLYRFNYK